MTMKMQEQASIGWLSIDLSFKFCFILDYLNADEKYPIHHIREASSWKLDWDQ